MADDETSPAVAVPIGEAAKRLRTSTNTVRRMIRAGKLAATRTRSVDDYTQDRHGREIRGHWRIDVASIDLYLSRRARAKARKKS